MGTLALVAYERITCNMLLSSNLPLITFSKALQTYTFFFYKKNIYKKMSLKHPKLKKILRKFPASNTVYLQFLKT